MAPLKHLVSAHVAFAVRAGSRFESRAHNGVSHFLEHMLFRGTASYPTAFAFNDAVERVGGSVDAMTYADWTLYRISVPPEELSLAFELLSEAFLTPRFLDIETEKGIVCEEILESMDDKGRVVDADDVSRAFLFGKHALGYRITGDEATVRSFKAGLLQTHLSRYYRARNALLLVAGAVDVATARKLAERTFGRMPRGELARTTPVRPKRGPRFVGVDTQGSQTDLRISFIASGEKDPDRWALEVLARVLDDGMSARLPRRLFEEKGLAYSIFAGLDLYEDCGVLDIGAAVQHQKVANFLVETFGVLRELCNEAVPEEELTRIKKRYSWEMRALHDDPIGLIHFVAPRVLAGAGITPKDALDRVLATTRDDVLRVARKVFDPSRLVVTAIGDLNPKQLETLNAIVDAFPRHRGK